MNTMKMQLKIKFKSKQKILVLKKKRKKNVSILTNWKEIGAFIQQACIQFVKSDSKDF